MENERKCKRCKHVLVETEAWFEEGSDYSVKLCRCSECGAVNIVRYYPDFQSKIGGINFDLRYYTYNDK